MRIGFISLRGLFLMGLITLVLAACTNKLIKKDSLIYSNDKDVVIIYANHNAWPGGSLPGQECNRIPNLRIWGDGHIVFSDVDNGSRRVLAGKISQEEIKGLFEMLDKMGFFNNPPPNSINPAGTGYQIIVNLEKQKYQSFWSNETEIYAVLINSIEQEHLDIYTPEEGLLVVGPYKASAAIDAFPKWPQNADFSLAEVGQEGKWISGEILLYVWEIINNQPEPLTGIEENGNIYAVGLEIRGISPEDPPYDCWNR